MQNKSFVIRPTASNRRAEKKETEFYTHARFRQRRRRREGEEVWKRYKILWKLLAKGNMYVWNCVGTSARWSFDRWQMICQHSREMAIWTERQCSVWLSFDNGRAAQMVIGHGMVGGEGWHRRGVARQQFTNSDTFICANLLANCPNNLKMVKCGRASAPNRH